MRYLRKQVLNRRAPWDQRLSVDINNAVVMTTTNNVTLPSGTTAERPVSPVNGMLRYNTDIVVGGELEVYQSGSWRSLRFKESSQIVQQNLGAGDSETVHFGPLNPAPPSLVQSNTTWGGQNLLVIVENVIQLNNINYTVVQNPLITGETYIGITSESINVGESTIYFNTSIDATNAVGDLTTVTLSFDLQPEKPFSIGSTIIVTNFDPIGYNGSYVVTACTNSSVSYSSSETGTMVAAGTITSDDTIYPAVNIVGATVSGSSSIPVGAVITSYDVDPNTNALTSITLDQALITSTLPESTSITIVDATNTGSGYFLQFSSPVPYGKTVTVLHGFDQ